MDSIKLILNDEVLFINQAEESLYFQQEDNSRRKIMTLTFYDTTEDEIIDLLHPQTKYNFSLENKEGVKLSYVDYEFQSTQTFINDERVVTLLFLTKVEYLDE